ncbi:MAG: 2-iminobutanoate/2-iminopropanoate deaminase, partial [Gammaproteobacteria bacterium]
MKLTPTEVNASKRIRVVDNQIVFAAGRLDIDDLGMIKNPGDISAQVSGIIAALELSLRKIDVSLAALVKLVVYYVQIDVDEIQLRQHLGQCLGTDVHTTVTFVPLRQLRCSGALAEIEAIAMLGDSARDVIVHGNLVEPGVGFCHGLKCGEFSFLSGQSSASRDSTILFADDLVSQNQKTIENLQIVLQTMGVDNSDIVKVNSWRAPATDYAAYKKAADDRFSFLGAATPAVTGITIPRLNAIGYQIRLDLWAMDSQVQRTPINPPDHWGWKIATSYSHGLQVGPWLFVGGQAALDKDCVVQHPENILKQIDVTKNFIENIINHASGDYEMVKLNGLFCDSTDPHPGSEIRQSLIDLFPDSQPITTFVPVDHLAYPQQTI